MQEPSRIREEAQAAYREHEAAQAQGKPATAQQQVRPCRRQLPQLPWLNARHQSGARVARFRCRGFGLCMHRCGRKLLAICDSAVLQVHQRPMCFPEPALSHTLPTPHSPCLRSSNPAYALLRWCLALMRRL